MIINEFQRFEEPETDYFELEAWNQGEIYRGEKYLEFDNGDLVLMEEDTIMEYLLDHYDFTLKLLEDVAIRKVAGE